MPVNLGIGLALAEPVEKVYRARAVAAPPTAETLGHMGKEAAVPVRLAMAVVAEPAAWRHWATHCGPAQAAQMKERLKAVSAVERLVVKELVARAGAMLASLAAAESQANPALAAGSFLSSAHVVLRRDPKVRRWFGQPVCLLARGRGWAAVTARLAEVMLPGCSLPCFCFGRFD